MSFLYQDVEFSSGDRLLLNFEDAEWIVMEVPSLWTGGASLDDIGFRILDEVLFPDSVTVLYGRDLGFSLSGIDTADVSSVRLGKYILVGKEDGTLLKFKPSWDDGENFYTSAVLGLDIDLAGNSEWTLKGLWD